MDKFLTTVFCLACNGPCDCNWEGVESQLLPPGDVDENDGDPYDEDMIPPGRCPECGSEANYGPSARIGSGDRPTTRGENP